MGDIIWLYRLGGTITGEFWWKTCLVILLFYALVGDFLTYDTSGDIFWALFALEAAILWAAFAVSARRLNALGVTRRIQAMALGSLFILMLAGRYIGLQDGVRAGDYVVGVVIIGYAVYALWKVVSWVASKDRGSGDVGPKRESASVSYRMTRKSEESDRWGNKVLVVVAIVATLLAFILPDVIKGFLYLLPNNRGCNWFTAWTYGECDVSNGAVLAVPLTLWALTVYFWLYSKRGRGRPVLVIDEAGLWYRGVGRLSWEKVHTYETFSAPGISEIVVQTFGYRRRGRDIDSFEITVSDLQGSGKQILADLDRYRAEYEQTKASKSP